MSARVPIKPARPHVVVGLSYMLGQDSHLEKLVAKHFSPLPSDFRQASVSHIEDGDLKANPHVQLDKLLICLFESTFHDTQSNQIPKNTAVFLALGTGIANHVELVNSLQDYFRVSVAPDLIVIVAEDSAQSLKDALMWLDRGECEFAMVAACELPKDTEDVSCKASAAAVLICNDSSASRDGLRVYASLQNFDLSYSRSIALLEIANNEWQSSAEPSRQWQATCKAQAKIDDAYLGDLVGTKYDLPCYVSTLALELSGGSQLLLPILAIQSSSMAIHLRVIPGASKHNLKIDNSISLLHSTVARPWIHPVSPVETFEPRHSCVNLGSENYLLSEFGEDVNTISFRNLQEQTSELFLFSGDSLQALKDNLILQAAKIKHAIDSPLANLAYEQNCLLGAASASPQLFKLACVANNHAELSIFLEQAITHIERNPDEPLAQIGVRTDAESHTQTILSPCTGIYYTGRRGGLQAPGRMQAAPTSAGKIAFVFPGLGAAYPHMLADLCFYFPEVRQVFDFVERLALKAGDKIVPSRAVFPAALATQSTSQAMLATMDSAVVTLLLAEWAIFALLSKLGVKADFLLGCSTGEFAALTISEAINIFDSAEIFYQLSTHVSRSISMRQLSELRSIRVTASFEEDLKPLIGSLSETVYLAADLSQSCVLLSGQKSAIEELCKSLRLNKIDYLALPVAVPYHTPLVSGKISEADVRLLEMGAPKVEAWSCSIEGRYPNDADALRRVSTDLFEKPIRLRSTIQRLYDADARIFVEVGPKGGLVPYISEILAGKEHLAVPTNLTAKSGIDQLNALLAVLLCNGVEMKLEALYQRRVRTEGAKAADRIDPRNDGSNHFDGSHDAYNPDELLNMLGSAADIMSDPATSEDSVMIAYLSTMQQFHASLIGTQERLLIAYLQGNESDEPAAALGEEDKSNAALGSLDALEPPAEFDQLAASKSHAASESLAEFRSVGLPENFAFIPQARLESDDDCFCIQFCLSTVLQPFLLDHAIGGSVTTSFESSKVSLVPLMVTLEIMSEGACLLHPQLKVSKLTDIRAYRRIRTNSKDLRLRLELRPAADQCVDARICLQNVGQDEAGLLASCKVEFCQTLPEGPVPEAFPTQESRASRLSPNKLYGEGSMFHGPLMQSVQSIDRVSKRSLEGRISGRPAHNWFAGQSGNVESGLVIDPLLLDNASQFVLYQLYEHELPVTALLPFHIASIEFFQGYNKLNGQAVRASAFLRSMSIHGTEAQIQLANEAGKIVAKVNDISSRAIALPDKFRNFVNNPASFLCTEIEIDGARSVSIASIAKNEMPKDETTLDWTTDYILTESEQKEWRQVGRTEKRRLDWLMGRIAAKDAVRILLQQELGIALKAADIEIRRAESGYAEVLIARKELAWIPQISISHCAQVAMAIAELPQKHRLSGIDVEEIVERDPGFAELAFTESELGWISQNNNSERSSRIAKLWTAKESVAKACGRGLSGNPKQYELMLGDCGSGAILKINAKAQTENESDSIYSCIVGLEEIPGVAIALVIDNPVVFDSD